MSVSKILAAAASSAGGAGLDVDEVFSTTVYDGNNSTQTITNNIDLSSEGGMVWTKSRSYGYDHVIYDTARGATYAIWPNKTMASEVNSNGVTAFNSNGYALGNRGEVNSSSETFVSWTFRNSPMFQVVKYSGTGSKRTVSHNLGSTPGMIIIKRIDAGGDGWDVWHRSLGGSGDDNNFLRLNSSNDASGSSRFGVYGTDDPTSTTFTVKNQSGVNASGGEYIAYLFAHNNNDGGFGPDQDKDIIKCDSYTGGNTGLEINVGFEPQFVMIKRASGTGDWMVFDAMRGVVNAASAPLDNTLFWNTSAAERTNTGYIGFTPTGFVHQGGSGDTNTSGQTYIYLAVRRGSLNVPDDATKVFAIDTMGSTSGNPAFKSNFVVDMALYKYYNGTQDWAIATRLMGTKHLEPNSTDTEKSDGTVDNFAFNTGYNNAATNSNYYSWMWKRAPEYFDVAAWSQASDTAVTTINHTLNKTPEMVWTKSRGGTRSWVVYHKDITPMLKLNETARANGTDPHQNVGSTSFQINGSVSGEIGGPEDYISYLFATVAGVSKISSVVHSGTTNVDAGFSNGSRFVLLKRTDANGDWLTWDGTRGIVSGNDPYLALNSTAAEVTNTDYIDPLSSGFTLTSNLTAGTYIYYAIA